ncbi:hypothetical protein Tco_0185030 [Tanacetum coccineum]
MGDHVLEMLGLGLVHEKFTCPKTLLPPYHYTQIDKTRKKRKKSKFEAEPIIKYGKLSKRGRTITCQSCGNVGHNKSTCKGQGEAPPTDGGVGQARGGAGVGQWQDKEKSSSSKNESRWEKFQSTFTAFWIAIETTTDRNNTCSY